MNESMPMQNDGMEQPKAASLKAADTMPMESAARKEAMPSKNETMQKPVGEDIDNGKMTSMEVESGED